MTDYNSKGELLDRFLRFLLFIKKKLIYMYMTDVFLISIIKHDKLATIEY